jgi:hypothetical protein
MRYEINNESIIKPVLIRYNDDDSVSYIPMDESNADYQAYLKSLDEAAPL